MSQTLFLTTSAYDLTEGRGGQVVRGIYTTLEHAAAASVGIDAQGTNGSVYRIESNVSYDGDGILRSLAYGRYLDAAGVWRYGIVPPESVPPARPQAETDALRRRWAELEKELGNPEQRRIEAQNAALLERALIMKRTTGTLFLLAKTFVRQVGDYPHDDVWPIGFFHTSIRAVDKMRILSERALERDTVFVAPVAIGDISNLSSLREHAISESVPAPEVDRDKSDESAQEYAKLTAELFGSRA